MGKCDLRQCGILTSLQFYDNLQIGYPFQQFHMTDLLFQELSCNLKILICHIHQHFQFLLCITAYSSKNGTGFNPF